jgi:crossover junction endodeoxyribonuclease RuvC
MYIIGIDPGLSGAIVVCDENGHIWDWWDTPTIQLAKGSAKREYDIVGMAGIVRTSKPDGYRAFIERQQAFPGQGVSSSFQTGRGYGIWLGLLAALALPYEIVDPRKWQKAILPGGPKGTSKARSLQFAGRQWPALPLTKPNGKKAVMDGRSDAACIALYGCRCVRGGVQ